jgi:hypothetical protein
MTYSTGTSYDFGLSYRGSFSRETFPHAVSGAVALTLSILVGSAVLYIHSVATSYAPPDANIRSYFTNFDEAPAPATAVVRTSDSYGALAAAPTVPSAPSLAGRALAGTPAAIVATDSYVGLLDPTYSLGAVSASLSQSSPLQSNFQPFVSSQPTEVAEEENVQPVPTPPVPQQLVQDIPLPARRPAEFSWPPSRGEAPPSGPEAAQQSAAVVAPEPSDHRSFLERIFGGSQSSGPALAYASAEDGVANEGQRSAAGPLPYDKQTAVYDISAHTVFLPDGTRLEAHSGLGDALDDPRYVSERMRGPTPPGVYDLQLREALFHGVQALRLIPVGNSDTFGRAGLLAHTFMLGQNGDSFGCVSFRDYQAFLRAYETGEVKRLTVVARLN